MKKILIIFGLIILIILFNQRYRLLPAKKVELNVPFTIHKWQSVTWEKGKYVTYCGTQGNAVAGTGPRAAYLLNIKGDKFTCTHKAIDYNMMSHGPTRPYSVKFLEEGNPALAVIKDSDQYYQEWSQSRFNAMCSRDLNAQEKEECVGYQVFYIGDPRVCNQQSLVSEKFCKDSYLNAFTKDCSIYPEQEVDSIPEGVWSQLIRTRGECFYFHITDRHLPSENCNLFIKNTATRNKCLENRNAEEQYLKKLKL